MPFRVPTLLEIVDNQVATVVANSELTDVNRGSVTRTIIEASAIQDADQYIQTARLKAAFSRKTATGDELDERGADFDVPRAAPTQAIGLVKFGDSDLTAKVQTTLASPAGIGSASLTLTSAASFPNSGFVILERDTVGQRELIAYSSKASNVLTLVGVTTISHSGGTSVLLSTVGSDRTQPAGSVVSAEATEATSQLDYTTQALATILDGDIVSNEVNAISSSTGVAYNVGTGRVSIIAAPAFPTMTVTNDTNFEGGQDLETDSDYQQRIDDTIQSLSTGNITALRTAALAVSLATGERVVTAQEVEEFSDPDVSVYIDNGLGTASTTAQVTTNELLIYNAEPGQRRAKLAHWPIVSGSLFLKSSAFRGVLSAVVPGVGVAVVTDSSAAYGVNALIGLTMVDLNQNFFPIVSNTATTITVTVTGANPIVGAYSVLPASYLVEGTDYLFNETTGDIELVSGLAQYDSLAAVPSVVAYTYYTGLIAEVQRVLNGDPDDLETYPGVKAEGVKVKVRAPSFQNISISITVLSSFGAIDDDTVTAVKDALQAYVNGLGIGADVVIAELIAAAMGVPGVTDAIINSPTTNVIVADGVLPRTKASLITVL